MKKQSLNPAMLASVCLCTLSACSTSLIDIKGRGEKTWEGRNLGSINLSSADSTEPSKLNIFKTRKGYAVKANLDRDLESERQGDIVIARDREYRWFAGLQWRLTF